MVSAINPYRRASSKMEVEDDKGKEEIETSNSLRKKDSRAQGHEAQVDEYEV